jgi:hypothetical protein
MVFTTIAYQLAHSRPRFGARLCEALKREADVDDEHVANQFNKFLKKPLKGLTGEIPTLIVMDALDECDMTTYNLLSILLKGIIYIP